MWLKSVQEYLGIDRVDEIVPPCTGTRDDVKGNIPRGGQCAGCKSAKAESMLRSNQASGRHCPGNSVCQFVPSPSGKQRAFDLIILFSFSPTPAFSWFAVSFTVQRRFASTSISQLPSGFFAGLSVGVGSSDCRIQSLPTTRQSAVWITRSQQAHIITIVRHKT